MSKKLYRWTSFGTGSYSAKKPHHMPSIFVSTEDGETIEIVFETVDEYRSLTHVMVGALSVIDSDGYRISGFKTKNNK